jgi:cytochrome oxidase Cu insertion factor (SCO1/SenC/PrrC family)
MKKLFPFLLLAFVFSLAGTSFSGCSKSKSGASAGNAGTASLENEPEVTFKDLQGNNVQLASFKGKVGE